MIASFMTSHTLMATYTTNLDIITATSTHTPTFTTKMGTTTTIVDMTTRGAVSMEPRKQCKLFSSSLALSITEGKTILI